MGRAQIVSNDGYGRYTITILHDTSIALGMLASYQQSLSDTQGRIAEETDADKLAQLNARKAALEKSIERMMVLTDELDYQVVAWCADYSENLSGFVGTIELAADPEEVINIRPGYSDMATFNSARDGQLVPFMTLPTADAILNFALFPAIQKWKPTYRYGTISKIDYDKHTCSVSLESVYSRMQGLNVNHTSQFDDIPIEYMHCNSYAFEDGDSVIIQFDPTDAIIGSPKVIGFKSNPRPCGIAIKISSINGMSDFGYAYYDVVLTQPDGSSGYTIISTQASLDGLHVAEPRLLPGVDIDLEKDLHVWLIDSNTLIDNKTFQYFYQTESLSPDYGVKLMPMTVDPYDIAVTWVKDPSDDLGDYDLLLNKTMGHRHGVNLNAQSKTSFHNAAGDNLQGWEITISGVLRLAADWYRMTTGIPPDTVGVDEYDKEVNTRVIRLRQMEYDAFNDADDPEFIYERFQFDDEVDSETPFSCQYTYGTCIVPCTCKRGYRVIYDGSNPSTRHTVSHDREFNYPCVMSTIDGVPLQSDAEAVSIYTYTEAVIFSCKNFIYTSQAACGYLEGYLAGDEPDEYFCYEGEWYCPFETVSEAEMKFSASLLNTEDLS